MIIGIGVDHIEIARIRKAIQKQKEKFLQKVFSDREIRYCENKKDKYQHYAARFAAKEAVYKALGAGDKEGIGWKDIEVVNNGSGIPEIMLHNSALHLAKKLKVSKIFLSISHNRNSAICQVVVETNSRC